MVCIHYTNILNTCVRQISHVKPVFLVLSSPVALFGGSKTGLDRTLKHCQLIMTDVSTHGASHNDLDLAANDNTSDTAAPPAVSEHEQADIIHPLNMPVKCPRLPDTADNAVKCTKMVEAKAEMSGGSGEVKVLADANSNEQC